MSVPLRRAAERGVTLVELMVVVVILAILAAGASIITKADSVGEGARSVAALLQEARRTAISGGAVRADVVATLGIRARARVLFSQGGAILEVLEEDPLPASTARWVEVSRVNMPSHVQIYKVDTLANTLGGEALPPDLAAAEVAERYYYANGSADALTVYLGSSIDLANKDQFRVFVLPLSGIPATYKGW